MAKYRVLIGKHVQTGPDGRDKIYCAGDVFDSNVNMLLFNGAGMQPKFERIDFEEEPSVSYSRVHPKQPEKEYQGQPENGKQELVYSDKEAVEEAARRGFYGEQQKQDVPTPTKAYAPPTAPTTTPPKQSATNKAELRKTLHEMTVQELKALAAEEEIDLKGATTKESIITAIEDAS